MRDYIIFILFLGFSTLIVFYAGLINPLASLIISVLLIIISSLLGIMTESVSKFLISHHLIQAGYVLLDVGVAGLSGKNALLSLVQLMNYAIAGTLLLVAKSDSRMINGIKVSKSGLIGLTIAALSLGGLPLFNLFVSEFPIYALSYEINPLLTGFLLLTSLIVLLNYVKILLPAYYNSRIKESSAARKFITYALSATCLLLGVIPQLELTLFEALS